MVILQLLINGLVTGTGLGMVAVSFALVYSTLRIFHVAHAGVWTLSGYVAYSVTRAGLPLAAGLAGGILAAAAAGALIQWLIYAPLARRGASNLVVLIASLGLLAVIQNVLAGIYSPDILQFPGSWAGGVVQFSGILLTRAQLATAVTGVVAYAGLAFFTRRTLLGKQIRAVAANPFLAEITRLQPRRVYVVVIAIASAVVALPGMLVPLDLGLQPYAGVTPLLTATIAMIAGGIGSLTGAFALSVAIAVLQNLSLLIMPGEWAIGSTFAVFVVFMLFRPQGLFATG
jgi:branched-chain amino acid transport system permease protein